MSELEKSTPTHKECDAYQAVKGLAQLFSTPEVKAKAHYRCGIGGPTELNVIFEEALDHVFGRDLDSEYKRWVRRLYKLGLISHMPDDWKDQILRPPAVGLGLGTLLSSAARQIPSAAFSTASARKDVIAYPSDSGSSARTSYPSRARCWISLSLISTLARRSPCLRRLRVACIRSLADVAMLRCDRCDVTSMINRLRRLR